MNDKPSGVDNSRFAVIVKRLDNARFAVPLVSQSLLAPRFSRQEESPTPPPRPRRGWLQLLAVLAKPTTGGKSSR